MSTSIDYYLSLNSPWTFLGHARIVAIAEKAGATLNLIPADFSVIFPQTGGLPVPKRAPARQAYRLMELKRWRSFLDIPLNLSPAHWPANDVLSTGMVSALIEAGGPAARLAGAFMHAVWVEDRDIADEATMLAIASEQEQDGDTLLQRARDGDLEQARQDNSRAAVERGVFGAPSYVIDDEIFWGQDRLDFVARKLGVSP